MAKPTFLDFSTTAADNTDINSIGIQGTNAVMNFDDAFRELMAILRRDLDNGMVLTSKSGNYTAVANDNNAYIRFSAAATLSLTAAATLGADWHCLVVADGGAVTVDPNSSETINGATTIIIPDGYTALIICDGTNFRATDPKSRLVSSATTATTSGTSVSITGIPSWARRVTVNFSGVSTSGVNILLLQIGTSLGNETTGYTSSGSLIVGAATASSSSTNGFVIRSTAATNTVNGSAVLTLLDAATNLWACSINLSVSGGSTGNVVGAGSKALPGVLDRIRLITDGGTDTFDAGSINIIYE